MRRLLLLPMIILIGCSGRPAKPPEMAKELGMSMSNKEKWPRLLTARFPTGTSERELVSTLKAQGFKVNQGAATAEYSWASFLCRADLYAKWKIDDQGRITSIDGTDWLACP